VIGLRHKGKFMEIKLREGNLKKVRIEEVESEIVRFVHNELI
jgi:hypothetical protein